MIVAFASRGNDGIIKVYRQAVDGSSKLFFTNLELSGDMQSP